MSAFLITRSRIESGVLFFDVVAGDHAVDSFDLSLQWNAAQIQGGLQVAGAAGWTVLSNATAAGQWQLGGYSLNPLAAGETLLSISIALNAGVHAIDWQLSGSVNDPAQTQALTTFHALEAPGNAAPQGEVFISGVAREGEWLTVSQNLTDADGMGAVSYQWMADGQDLSGSTGHQLLLTPALLGQTISARALYIDGLGHAEQVLSRPTDPVVGLSPSADLQLSSVLLSGGVLSFQWVLSQGTLDSVDLVLDLSPNLGGNLQLTPASGWTLLASQQSPGHWLIAGYSLTPLQASQTLASAQWVLDSASTRQLGIAYSGEFNDPAVRLPTHARVIQATNASPTGSVTISGTATQGQTLTAANTLADADGLGPITYTWKANGSTVGTGMSYQLTQAEVGKTITVTASYTDGGNTVESRTSTATASVANVNDAPTGSVTISGTATQGQTLTAANTLADLDGLGPVTYTWKAGGSTVGSGSSYVLTQAEVGKTVTVTASYTDGFGKFESKTSAASAEVVNVNDAPAGTLTWSGTATQGQTLSVQNRITDADGLGPMNYQWLADGVAIAGATGASLVLTQAQVGKAVAVRASYTDGQGSLEQVTSASAVVANVNDAPTGRLLVQGSASRGETLVVSSSLQDADGLGPITYTWKAGGTTVGTGTSYVLTQAEVGKTVTVTARYTDGGNTPEQVESAATATVTAINHAPTGSVTQSGVATQGQTLTASHTVQDADGLGSVSYQWRADGVVIEGASGNSLILTQAQVGHAITAVLRYTDGGGTAEAVQSAASALVQNINDAPVLAHALGDQTFYNEQAWQLSLPIANFQDPDGDPLTLSVGLEGGGALPAWLHYDALAHTLSVAAGAAVVGRYRLQVSASDGSLSTSDTLTLTVSLTPHTADGAVQDGYVAGAKLYVDRNGNGVADPDEDTGLRTDSQGNFSGTIYGAGALIAVGGTNIDTGLRNLMQLKAPEGSSVINPVTTLVQALVATGQTVQSAQSQVVQAFGLPGQIDLLSYDPLQSGGADADALTVQKLSAQLAITATLAQDSASVMTALAGTLNQSTGPVSLSDTQVLSQVLGAQAGTLSEAISQANSQVQASESLQTVAQDQRSAVISNLAMDLSAPTRVGMSPAIGAKQVAPSADLVLQFSEAVQAGDGTLVLQTVSGQTVESFDAHSARLSWSGSTLTVDPSQNLSAGTTYRLVMAPGVVQDTSGNAYVGSRDLVFTTAGVTGGVAGSDGDDSLVGGAGNDVFTLGLGNDSVTGGAGQDRAHLAMFPNVYALSGSGTVTGGYAGYSLSLSSIEQVSFGRRFETVLDMDQLTSGAAQDGLAKLTDLYLAFFGRAPDVAGLEYWMQSHFNGGKDLALIAKDFSWSAEAQALFPASAGNRDFVRLVYVNSFGREPDVGGWDWWTARLDALNPNDPEYLNNRGMFVGQLLLGAYAPTSGPEDRTLLTHKHDVAMAYVNALSVHPEEGFDGAINDLLARVDGTTASRTGAIAVIEAVFDQPITLTGVMHDAALLHSLWGQ